VPKKPFLAPIFEVRRCHLRGRKAAPNGCEVGTFLPERYILTLFQPEIKEMEPLDFPEAPKIET